MENTENISWVPILDYATLTKKSISTIRRHIKSGKMGSKKVDGKYFIKTSGEMFSRSSARDEEKLLSKIEEQKLEIRKLTIDNSELKMLVDLYEAQLAPKNIPPIPVK